jgi:tetratricopeptide (TPR) repeat protein
LQKLHGWIVLLFLILSPTLKAQGYKNSALIKAFKFYKTSNYSKAIETLENARGSKKVLGTRFYLAGIILNRMQRYDEAAISFKKALTYGNESEDIYYEYGQALYANSELVEARKAFKISSKKKFKENSSLYYVAHISQLLEEHKVAKIAYVQLIKNAKSDKKLQQIARFQLSESFLALAENKDDSARLVEKYVIPALKEAFDTLPKAPLAKDIKKRRKEIEKQYGLDPNLMKNGRILSKDRLSASVSHQFSWDSNITLATDVPTAASLQKDTFIHTTNANVQRIWQMGGVYTITPFLRLSNTYHMDRENGTVHQNDTHTWSTGFKTTHEHKLFNRQANSIFDLNYTYTGRDTNQRKDNQFFARDLNFTIGERVRFFGFGPTTFKYSYKDYTGYIATIDNRTHTISVDQIKGLSSGNLLIVLFNASFIEQVNNPSGSTNNYLTRVDYLIPEILPTYTLSYALSVSFLDTKLQKATRGIEKSITPTVELRKSINSHLSASLGYDFTRNISKNKTSFDYKKHVVRFQLSASY